MIVVTIKPTLAACPSQTGSLHFKFNAVDALIQSCMPIANRLIVFQVHAVDALIQIQEARPSMRSVAQVEEAWHQRREA